MHLELGGYHIGDIDFVAAFDIAVGKVGCELAKAILEPPNNTERFASVPPLGVEVRRGPTYDGIGRYLQDVVVESRAAEDDVAKTLRTTGVEVLCLIYRSGRRPHRAGMRSRRWRRAALL
jgi:myo-inositol-1-phosphate synthase